MQQKTQLLILQGFFKLSQKTFRSAQMSTAYRTVTSHVWKKIHQSGNSKGNFRSLTKKRRKEKGSAIDDLSNERAFTLLVRQTCTSTIGAYTHACMCVGGTQCVVMCVSIQRYRV